MSIVKQGTFRFEDPLRTRVEVSVKLALKAPHERQLYTDLQPVTESYETLSISMGSWERARNGRWREAHFGQDIETVAAFAKTQPAKVRAALERLCAVWREWHPNDVQAGTDAQQAAIKAAGELDRLNWYDAACTALAAVDLLDDHGYRYGSQWLVKRLPRDVQLELDAVFSELAALNAGAP